MMNFKGQVSPIFLAMDEDYIVPSNNQGGPTPDPRSQLSQKPVVRPPEYKHEISSLFLDNISHKLNMHTRLSLKGIQNRTSQSQNPKPAKYQQE